MKRIIYIANLLICILNAEPISALNTWENKEFAKKIAIKINDFLYCINPPVSVDCLNLQKNIKI